MTPPPLPPAFGNYALGDFVEVVPPDPVSWLPQTAGWAVIALVAAGFALRYAWRKLRQWHRNRYRREAAEQLQRLPQQDDGTLTAQFNDLLKRAVLAHRPRREVASLTGDAWVAYLNSRCPAAVFTDDSAQLLASGGYRQQQLTDKQVRALQAASLTWFEQHEDPVHADTGQSANV